jgi:hypothetical protein
MVGWDRHQVTKFRVIFVIIVVCLEISCFSWEVCAQKENVFLHPKKFYKKFFPHLKIKKDIPDSAYIKVYPNYLSVNVQVLSPFIQSDIEPQKSNPKAIASFKTNISDIIGFSATYRFITAGFAVLLPFGVQTHADYAKSYYRTATIKYNNRSKSFQFRYLRFKGLTDVNMPANADGSNNYIKRPDIVNKEFQFEGLYNPGWRKYSYTAPFTFSERQIKSRAGFLLNTGLFYRQLSGDSALIDKRKQEYFNGFEDITTIRTFSIRIAPGAGGTLVFLKRYYLSVAVFPSYDLYFYKYLTHSDEKVKGKQTFAFVLDGKASIGYQSKRLYAGIRYETERSTASLSYIQTKNMNTYLGLEVGYRFNTPRLVKKVYKDTMPPGM